jgi:hypothetical protein
VAKNDSEDRRFSMKFREENKTLKETESQSTTNTRQLPLMPTVTYRNGCRSASKDRQKRRKLQLQRLVYHLNW